METPIQDEHEFHNSLAHLEQGSTSIVSLRRAADVLRRIAQHHRESGNTKRAQELLWESEALVLSIDGQYRYPEAQEYLFDRIEHLEGNPLWKSRLWRALVCLNPDYNTTLAYAGSCEQVIAYFRRSDSPPEDMYPRSFAANAQHDWFEVVQCYQEAMDIYLTYGKHDQAKALLTSLFQLIQTCDEYTSRLALQLLLVLEGSVNKLEEVAPGTRNQLKTALREAIRQKTLEHEIDFLLLAAIRSDDPKEKHRSALELLRDLADDDQERETVDVALCQTMELAAQLCSRRGNIDASEMWYRDAARIARERLGDSERVGRLLKAASHIPLQRAQRPPTDLDMLVIKAAEEHHRERFLPSAEQFLDEYAPTDDKLARLLTDERLLLDKATIAPRVAQFRDKELSGSGWLTGHFTDERGNPRGDYPFEAPFIEQYVRELAGIIGTLFDAWQKSGSLVDRQIITLLERKVPDYDRAAFEVGLSRHFQSDYTSAIHILVPRFEDFVFWCAETEGITTKRLKDQRPGEALLGDLLRPDNAEMRDFLGEALLELAWWYMVNSAGPFNWRNKVAHGWVRSTECNVELSAMIIYLTLQVADKAKGRDAA
jgi:hypothetical protein